MRLTVRCPADGVIEVTVRDLETVVVRSGQDVEATYRCPACGSPVRVTSELSSGLLVWATCSAGCPGSSDSGITVRGARSTALFAEPSATAHDEAYMEYFRRELASTWCVEDMVALMRAAERRRFDRSARRS
jgi:hypothetical protein